MAQAALDEFNSTGTDTDAEPGEDTDDDWNEGDKILFRNAVTRVIEPVDDDHVAVKSPTVDGGRLVADREHLAEPHNPGAE